MKIRAKVYCNGAVYCTDNIDIVRHLAYELKARKITEHHEQSSTLTKKIKDKIKKSLDTKNCKYIANYNSVKILYTDAKNQIINIKKYCVDNYLDIFTKKHIIPDVWRYTIKVCNGDFQLLPIIKDEELRSDFSDRPAIDAIGTKIILLVLESPHTSEYEDKPKSSNELKPKAPAQGKNPGDAGGAIEQYLYIILRQTNLANGFYSLVISNPIPYQCSLGCIVNRLNKNIRDAVWEAIWKTKDVDNNYVIQENFIARYATYQPVCTINCCTESLTNFVSDLLIKNNIDNLYKTHHPAMQWNIKKDKLAIHKMI